MVNAFGGEWTKTKLRILEGYLKAYTTVMKNQNFCLTYVDGFAGTGYVDLATGDVAHVKTSIPESGWDEESANLLKGSTSLALEVDGRAFDKFIFIEKDSDNVTELFNLKQRFPNRDVSIFQEDANKFLQYWCLSQNRRLGSPWKGERAVIFLDPFGTQVAWNTIQRISETKSVDLWILFPLSALTRMLPNRRMPNEATAATLDRIFGNQKWRDIYKTQFRPTLFGVEVKLVRDDQQAIVDLYLSNLKDIFPAVTKNPRWLRNSLNSPLFTLMFAAANPGRGGEIALGIANHLLDRW